MVVAMRIFVSSTFEDLREHRAAAIRVLRQLGHEVLAMEDLVAASAAPLVKVIEMIDRSDAYVGIFAQVRRILIVKSNSPAEEFIGQISTAAIRFIIEAKLPVLEMFRGSLRARPTILDDVDQEINLVMAEWQGALGAQSERSIKVDLTPELLRRWFSEAMFQQPIHITDLERASVVDLLRLLDYPNDYVPVITRRALTTGSLSVSQQWMYWTRRPSTHVWRVATCWS